MSVDYREIIRRFFGDFPITTTFGAPSATTGEPHLAVDIGTPFGTPLRAPRGGRVHLINDPAAGGIEEDVRTPGGFDEIFAHLGSVTVQEGQDVSEGDLIGFTGASGRVTGPHLHFEVRDPQGRPTDPLEFLGGATGAPEEVAVEARQEVRAIGGRSCPPGQYYSGLEGRCVPDDHVSDPRGHPENIIGAVLDPRGTADKIGKNVQGAADAIGGAASGVKDQFVQQLGATVATTGTGILVAGVIVVIGVMGLAALAKDG